MSEQAGSSLAAIRARQSALERHHDSAAEADRALADALAAAHGAIRDSVSRLDAIAAEIDRVTAAEDAAESPLAARERQRFLVAKQREIASVVEQAHALDRAKAAALHSLREHYTPGAG
jgi:hypothetical protein